MATNMSKRKTTSRQVPPGCVYELMVSLNFVEPRVWRRLWVPDSLTLAQLHLVIQTAMGWTNSHLHEFEIAGKRYEPVDEQAQMHGPAGLDETHVRLTEVLGPEVASFMYTYDFGDNWRHTVLIERRKRVNESINAWPMCVAGQRACPPEDVGGSGGYQDFLEAIGDPAHEEHIAMWRWNGGPFDPNGFDLNRVNAVLRELI